MLLGQSLFINVALLVVPLYTLQIFERVLMSGRLETLVYLFIAVVIVGIAALFVEHERRAVMLTLANFTDTQIKPVLLDNAIGRETKISLSQLNGLELLIGQLRTASYTVLLDAFWIPMAILITYLIHPALGLLVLVANALFAVASIYKIQTAAPVEAALLKKRALALTKSRLSADTFHWHKIHRLNPQATIDIEHLTERADFLNQRLANAQQSIKWLFQIMLPSVGALLLVRDEISIGAFIAALFIASRAILPMEGVFNNLSYFKESFLLLKDITATLDNIDSEEGGQYGADRLNGVELELPYSLAGQAPKAQLSIRAGDMIALIGDTTTDKTRITKYIAGLTDIENAESRYCGVRDSDWRPEALAAHISWAPSSLDIFGERIVDLITRNGAITIETAIDTAIKTGLDDALTRSGKDYSLTIEPGWQDTPQGRYLLKLITLTATFAKYADLYVLENPELDLGLDALNHLAKHLNELKARGAMIVIATDSQRICALANQTYLIDGDVMRAVDTNHPEEHKNVTPLQTKHNRS